MSQVLGYFQAQAVNIPSSAESAILTTGGINSGETNTVNIRGSINVSPGASTTSYTIRLRQGNGITGNVVDTTDSVPVSGAAADTLEYDYEDVTGWVAQLNAQYTVSVQMNAATGAGTANYVDCTVEAF